MKNVKTLLCSGLFPMALAGCISSPVKIHPVDAQSLYMAELSTDRRSAWIVKAQTDNSSPQPSDGKNASDSKAAQPSRPGLYRICTEPPADVGLSTSQILELTANLKKADADATLKNSLTSNLVELRGRTPAVLALRDVMYRICEMSLNYGRALNETELATYTKAIEVINRFAQADLEDAQTQKAIAFGTTNAIMQAKNFERAGYDALAKKDFKGALDKFNTCEAQVVGFRACFDIGYAIRINKDKDDASKATAVLKYKDYLPADAEKAMEDIAKAANTSKAKK